MSLYFEASAILANANKTGGSLKSRIYKEKGLKNTPAHIFALVSESSKWSGVLKEVVERSGILQIEKKLTPTLSILLAHDLLLAKSGVAAPANHALTLAIHRHKARLKAEFTKARLRRGFSSVEAFRAHIEAGNDAATSSAPGPDEKAPTAYMHPRWVRVNTLRTTLDKVLKEHFSNFTQKDSLQDVLTAAPTARIFHVDEHVPDLVAFPRRTDLSKCPAYLDGRLIIQDKASCFPAYLIDPNPDYGDVIDACAAPGNKTTHLAAIVSKHGKAEEEDNSTPQRILAFERDKYRAISLKKMVQRAGADTIVTVKADHDFLHADPNSKEMARVGILLLDPSCSGSGIVGRDDGLTLTLPSTQPAAPPSTTNPARRNKKRKRAAPDSTETKNTKPSKSAKPHPSSTSTPSTMEIDGEEQEQDEHQDPSDPSPQTQKARLAALAAFQLKLLLHAMSFPNARRISYSTCSIHAEENEGVVVRALAHATTNHRGWRILRRGEQVDGMRRWGVRGEGESLRGLGLGRSLGEKDGGDGAEKGRMDGKGDGKGDGSILGLTAEQVEEVVEGCVRCNKGTAEGTMGFFVAGFVRDEADLAMVASRDGVDGMQVDGHGDGGDEAEEEEEWSGIED